MINSQRFLILLVGFVLFSLNSLAEDVVTDDFNPKATYVLCKNKAEVRTVRITTSGSNCKATYSKSGVESVVAKSGTVELCFDVATKIRKNLTSAAWKCRDISDSRVSNSIE